MPWEDHYGWEKYADSGGLGTLDASFATEDLLYRPDADPLNFSDVVALFSSLSTSSSSDLQGWNDAISALFRYLALHAPDSLNNFDDSTVAGYLAYLASNPSDPLGSYNDNAATGFLTYFASLGPDDFNAWIDQITKSLTELGNTPIEINTLVESLQNWFDTFTGFETYTASASDTMAAWDDTPAGRLAHNPSLTDDWSNLSDLFSSFRTMSARLDPDALNLWNDLFAYTYGKGYRLGPDDFNSWLDSKVYNLGWRLADRLDLDVGSIVSGTLDSTYVADGVTLDLSEVSGTPGFEYTFWFGDVFTIPGTPITLHMRAYYGGNLGHTVLLYQYNYNTLSFDRVTAAAKDFPDQTSLQDYTFSLLNDANHVSAGKVVLRIEQTSAGNPTHQFHIDQMYLTISELLYSLSDDAAFLNDTYGSNLNYLASLDTDILNAFADILRPFFTLGQTLPADSMAAWDDTEYGRLAHNSALTDDWSQLADLGTFFQNTSARPDSDNLNSWSDSLNILFNLLAHLSDDFNSWSDYVTKTLSELGATPIEINTLIDSLQAWLDSLNGLQRYFASLPSDSFATWDDTSQGFLTHNQSLLDDWSNLADTLTVRRIGNLFTALTDSLESWADANGVLLGQFASATDSMATWDDTPAGQLAHNPLLVDDWSNLSDTIRNLQGLLHSLSPDDLNAWADFLSLNVGTPGALMVAFVDSMATWDDSSSGRESHNAALIDDWSNLLDRLRLRLGGTGGVVEPTYIIVGLNQTGQQGPSIGGM